MTFQNRNKKNKRKRSSQKNPTLNYIVIGVLALIFLFTGGIDLIKERLLGESGRAFDGNYETVLSGIQSKPIIYTKHAKCRMGCREIDKGEINEILQKGKINPRKSKPTDAPCPTYAVEGFTSDNQEVRIVFADCATKTKVITAIDLRNKYQCHCE